MRGGLIFPVVATIARVDTEQIETDSGYDDDFHDLKSEDVSGDGVGQLMRREKDPIDLPVQVEPDREEMMRMAPIGNVAETAIGLVLHFIDLERLGLSHSDGTLDLGIGDRLVRLKDRRGARVIKEFDRVPVYCTQVRHLSAWLGGTSNLLLLLFEERSQGIK